MAHPSYRSADWISPVDARQGSSVDHRVGCTVGQVDLELRDQGQLASP